MKKIYLSIVKLFIVSNLVYYLNVYNFLLCCIMLNKRITKPISAQY